MAKRFKPKMPGSVNAAPRQPWVVSPALPPNCLTLVLGKPGAGKTVFALQILVSGAQRGEPALFVSFARDAGGLLASAAGFGWDLAQMEAHKLILLLSRQQRSLPKSGRPDLGRALEVLRVKATNLGARRIIFDGLDLWLPAAYDPMAAVEEVYRIRDWLFENQFMGLITTTPSEHSHGLMPFAADCTIVLRQSKLSERPMRHLLLAKRRGWRLVEEDLPFMIGAAGIELLVARHTTERPGNEPASLPPQEVLLARNQLIKGFQNLDRFLELKQAELDFRLTHQSMSCVSR